MINKLLPEVCDVQYGYAFDSSLFSDEQGLPLVRIRDVVRGYSETKTTENCPDQYIVHDGDLLIGMDGEFNIAKWKGGKALLNQRVCKLIPKSEIMEPDYLYYYMPIALKAIEDKTPFVTVKHLSAKEINKVSVPTPEIKVQRKSAKVFALIDFLLNSSNTYLNKLDELIKSRFVEMFGDIYQAKYNTHPMTELCEIIDGDRGKNYPKQEEFYENGYCLFLNAKNVTAHGFDFSQCMFITKEKDKSLRKGKLQRGDVILTTRGTIGNLAYYTDDIPFDNMRINSGMVILRMSNHLMNEVFFIEQFKMHLTDIKEKIASGSAQPQLPISTMNKIKLTVPPIELQEDFAAIVNKVQQQKATVQKSIDRLETLKKSLMQEYFG